MALEHQGRGSSRGFGFLAVAVLGLVGCSSVEKLAIKKVAASLGSGSVVFAQDDDPELVGQALPATLKLTEVMLQKAPEDRNLLLAACSGFTQYAYAFVDTEAFFIEPEDFLRARELETRALKLYLRAQGYCMEGLTLVRPGIDKELQLAPERAAARLGKEHLDLMFWTAASWGAAIAKGQNRPELTADLPAVRSLLERALALDETYQGGALHEAMITLEALPKALGGSEEKAREHFDRAVELSGGRSAGAYVTLARTVAVANQQRAEFESLLRSALAVDVDAEDGRNRRLANVLAQRQAEELLRRADDYFFAAEEEPESPASEGETP